MEPYQRLEVEFDRWLGSSTHTSAVVCSSGTAALHLALEALQLPRDSLILVPNYTMIACARAVILAGHHPVFIDPEPKTLTIDVGLAKKAMERFTEIDESESLRLGEPVGDTVAAIMPVHVYGRQCDMESIHKLAGEYNLYVIEDLAEAHGVAPHPDTDVACWSFYKNKIIAGEEGGILTTPHSEVAKRARSLRSMGFTDEHNYTHIPRGHNYRLANCLADKILTSLRHYPHNVQARWQLTDLYEYHCPPEWRMPQRDAPWVYDICIVIPTMDNKLQQDIVTALRLSGIQARYGFKSMTTQEEFSDYPAMLSRSNALDGLDINVVYFPIDPGVTSEHDIIRGFDIVNKVLRSSISTL